MTSEVVVMNKRAIVLAADSAVTITTWKDGKREYRYVKGANKVFELSDAQPVGAMIFNSSAMHSVPWEILIKSYRAHLGKNGFSSLREYALDFFSFMENSSNFFPIGRQDDVLKAKVIDAFFEFLVEIDRAPSVRAAKGDATKQNAARDAIFVNLQAKVAAEAIPSHFPANAITDAITKFGTDISIAIGEVLQKKGWTTKQQDFVNLSFEAIFKRYRRYLDHTGIVVAGYGEQDFFPRYAHFDCYGLINGKLIVDKTEEEEVTFDNGARIKPFAMSAMVQTFMLGISPDLFDCIAAGIEEAFEGVAAAVGTQFGSAPLPATLTSEFDAARQKVLDSLTETAVSGHFSPLNRAIESLPVEDMAGLAETLIMLESLKEKVTRPSESVGGAVDVAVITKTEGVVWVKRKHFFSADLNPKFLERQKQRLA